MFSLLVFELQNAQFPASRRRPMYKPSRAKDGFVIIAAVSNYNFDNLFVPIGHPRPEEHTTELQSLMRNSYAVFCLNTKKLNSQKYIFSATVYYHDKRNR